MTSQRTIEKCREKVKAMDLSNRILLDNNCKLREENNKLILENQSLRDDKRKIESEKFLCKQKCEVALNEKDMLIQQKDQKLQNLKDLRDIKWSHSMQNGKIILTGELP